MYAIVCLRCVSPNQEDKFYAFQDEENMNLKERLRAEVRKELHKLEVTCSDMASLLRGLGILVNGGLHPLSQEVSTLSFSVLHPELFSKI